jgi:16S rRNA (adenine1518-N6/adenine1519-N6)-dimethyltransferase
LTLDLTDPRQLRDLLKKYRLWAKKRLGQNFLVDRSVLETIVDTANLLPEDTVVEIGPGPGVLTRELLPRVKNVFAVEIDADILPVLKETTNFFRNKLTICHQHVLQFVLPETDYKIVANIPYHLTSPIMRKFLTEAKNRPQSMTLLVQKEVAEKICDTKHRSILSLFVEAFGTPRIVTNVPATSFSPPPKVESAVLHIDVLPKPKISVDSKKFFSVVKQGFNQRRKKLKHNLPIKILQQAEIDENLRAESLTIEDWERIASQQ